MKVWIKAGVAAICVVGLAVAVLAHPAVFKGKVIGAVGDKLTADVAKPGATKPDPMVFVLTKDTKILRDDKVVTLAAARIQKGEAVAVTIDMDEDTNEALVVRLGTSK